MRRRRRRRRRRSRVGVDAMALPVRLFGGLTGPPGGSSEGHQHGHQNHLYSQLVKC